MTQQEWRKVAQPERWRWTPSPGQAIIGEYRGRATANGMYGPYTKHFIAAETEEGHKIFSVSGVVLDNIMLMVNVGDTIRLVYDRIDSTGCRHWSVYKPTYGARVKGPRKVDFPIPAEGVGPGDFGGSDYACHKCGGELCTGQCQTRDSDFAVNGDHDPDCPE